MLFYYAQLLVTLQPTQSLGWRAGLIGCGKYKLHSLLTWTAGGASVFPASSDFAASAVSLAGVAGASAAEA